MVRICSESIIKLVISVILDIGDLIFGWVPIYGTIYDGIVTAIAYAMWGPVGLISGWEVIALGPGNAIDAFIPSCTIAGIVEIARDGSNACTLPLKK